ncbi:MAG: SdpI family protein [Candidatus Paceibacterota bacterium]
MPKVWGLFLLPIMSLMLFGLFLIIPKIDPLKANVAKFQKYFDGFILVFEIFFLYIYLLTISWSLGSRFDMTAVMMPALAILFYYMGILVGQAERNFFIGIRTPWTLSSDTVWKKTHRLGGKLFKAVAVLTALGFFFPAYAILLMLLPVIGVSIYLTVYSYFEFKKEKD